MAEIYAALIRKGIKSIDDVPANLRADVEKILKKREILEQERYLREKAVGNALCAFCRDRILQGYINYKQRGGITAPELETINKLYNAYHALGGNGTITAVFEKIIHLPIKED